MKSTVVRFSSIRRIWAAAEGIPDYYETISSKPTARAKQARAVAGTLQT